MFDFIKTNMKVADAILAVSVAGIALALFLFNIIQGKNIDRLQVSIYQDAKLIETYTIDDSFSLTKIYTSDRGSNKMVIENNEVYIIESSCPDHLCELMGKISKPGEIITCLPNRLQIVIEGDKEDIDSINF